MLEELYIENLILIDTMRIPFGKGLNVLTGETGSGKSAIIQGLNLLSGQRADLSVIRQGCDTGAVQGVFSWTPTIAELLDQAGIHADSSEPLIIKREVSAKKRGRTWINNQLVHIQVLKTLSVHLFEIIGQYASQKLFSPSYQQTLLDLYAGIEIETFTRSWKEEKKLRAELATMQQQEAQRLRDRDRYQAESDELAEAAIKEEEDEELFTEYSRLTHCQEIHKKMDSIYNSLSHGKHSVIAALKMQKCTMDELLSLDSTLAPLSEQYKSCLVEMEEVAYSIRDYRSQLGVEPSRIEEVNDRLSLINQIKRKYGPTFKDIQEYTLTLEEKLDTIDNSSFQMEELEEKILTLAKRNDEKAKAITQKREGKAKKLSALISSELKQLNMPQAELQIKVSPAERGSSGDDLITFFIKPNLGEEFLQLKECASGGELSRILLAIQTITSELASLSCLIFDEIDANIGGETAKGVGEKLKKIAQSHQVLCITHFAQVACQGDHHILITKKERAGRTYTSTRLLESDQRSQELTRMLGGISVSQILGRR